MNSLTVAVNVNIAVDHPSCLFRNCRVIVVHEVSYDKNWVSFGDAAEIANIVEDRPAALDTGALTGRLLALGLDCSLVALHKSLYEPSYLI
jgi:hypothetical protein